MLSILLLSACQEGGGSSSNSSPEARIVAPDTTPVEANLTKVDYYTHSRTEAPVSQWIYKTYTATGSCANFNGKTFCWSDGNKILQWESNGIYYGPLGYNYFGMQLRTGRPNSCWGSCENDYMQSPKQITTSLLNTLSASKVQAVFDQGSLQTMDCDIQQTRAVCGSLVFEGI